MRGCGFRFISCSRAMYVKALIGWSGTTGGERAVREPPLRMTAWAVGGYPLHAFAGTCLVGTTPGAPLTPISQFGLLVGLGQYTNDESRWE